MKKEQEFLPRRRDTLTGAGGREADKKEEKY